MVTLREGTPLMEQTANLAAGGAATAACRAEHRYLRPLQDMLEESYPHLVFAQAGLWSLPRYLEATGMPLELQRSVPIFNLPTIQPPERRLEEEEDEEGCPECEGSGCGRWGCFEFRWQGSPFAAAFIPVAGNWSVETKMYLGAPSLAHVQSFVNAMQEWVDQPRQEVWVYQRGSWQVARHLLHDVRSFSWQDVVLPPEMKADLTGTVEGFFADRESYGALGLAYKRGLLFLGPPGCGKTLTLRIIAGQMQVPFFYVRSFDPQDVEGNLDEIFHTAMRRAPCVVCWEDMDRLIPEQQMGFFLNSLDGLEMAAGLLTVGTSNHPERVDRALLQRPSRFDRVFWFGLPAEGVRADYLLGRLPRLERIGVQGDWAARARHLAAATEGYSFAYLQELFAQIGFDLLHARGAFDEAAGAALKRLGEAIALAESLEPAPQDGADDGAAERIARLPLRRPRS